ncbi:hypothetical protein FDP41_008886 [Naegleria fowleri]|uniref:Uncharacterized protein n=1 Tax=Naegleria fowleri TaxID=5763 RepID=A0A6A5B3E9_NAEFO|nr:uncharacterized protein FDP41_008886 [Naegleria fowleri]KAF0972637.1 hypothetical protein FDP41_008886 [Naegleria fowleri]
MSSPLVFQKSTGIKGKNKYWQFVISPSPHTSSSHMSDSEEDDACDDEFSQSIINNNNNNNILTLSTPHSFYILSRHGTTTLHPLTHTIHTTKGISYQKEFPSELQAQKELLIRIHSKLKEGYEWVYERKKRKFPLETLVALVNEKIQEQYELFRELAKALSNRNRVAQSTTNSTISLASASPPSPPSTNREDDLGRVVDDLLPFKLRNISLPRVSSPQRLTKLVLHRLGLTPTKNIPNLPPLVGLHSNSLRRRSTKKTKNQKVPIIEFSSSESDDESREQTFSPPPRVARRKSTTVTKTILNNKKRNASTKRKHSSNSSKRHDNDSSSSNSSSDSSSSSESEEGDEQFTTIQARRRRTKAPQKKKTKRDLTPRIHSPTSSRDVSIVEQRQAENDSTLYPSILLSTPRSQKPCSSSVSTSTITPLVLSPIPYRSRRQVPTAAEATVEEGLDHSSSDDDEGGIEEFYGEIIIANTPERFQSTDTPHGNDNINLITPSTSSLNISRPLSDIDSGSDREDDNALARSSIRSHGGVNSSSSILFTSPFGMNDSSFGGGFEDDLNDNYSFVNRSNVTSDNNAHISSTLIQQELEEKIKKLSQTITMETERANALDLEKNYLERKMIELVELHRQELVEKDDQREEEIITLKRRMDELNHSVHLRQEELYRKEELLRELEKKFEEERMQCNQQREMVESLSQDLSCRIEQVQRRESLLEMNERELEERMKQIENEQMTLSTEKNALQEQVNKFEIEKENFMQDLEQKNILFEREVSERFHKQQKDLEIERQKLENEYHENMQLLNQEKEKLRAQQMDFELVESSRREWYELKCREISEKETEIANQQVQLEQKLQYLKVCEDAFEIRQQQHEDLISKRNSNLDMKEHTFQREKEQFEKERQAFTQLFEKRMEYENHCQQLGLALSQKHTEFQSALSVWLSALNYSTRKETMDDEGDDNHRTIIFSGANLDSDL